MRVRMVVSIIAVAAGILMIVSSGSAGSAAAGGTVLFGAEQEPGILNTAIIGGNLFWGGEVVSPVFPTTFRIYPNFSIRPELVSNVTLTKRPFSLTYHIKKNAVWY